MVFYEMIFVKVLFTFNSVIWHLIYKSLRIILHTESFLGSHKFTKQTMIVKFKPNLISESLR